MNVTTSPPLRHIPLSPPEDVPLASNSRNSPINESAAIPPGSVAYIDVSNDALPILNHSVESKKSLNRFLISSSPAHEDQSDRHHRPSAPTPVTTSPHSLLLLAADSPYSTEIHGPPARQPYPSPRIPLKTTSFSFNDLDALSKIKGLIETALTSNDARKDTAASIRKTTKKRQVKSRVSRVHERPGSGHEHERGPAPLILQQLPPRLVERETPGPNISVSSTLPSLDSNVARPLQRSRRE
jgi:hypothetical protein